MVKKASRKKVPVAVPTGAEKLKRSRRTPLFPAASFEEALTIANAIQKHAAGQKVRRLTLFDQMGKSPDSGPSRQLIVNSNKYGLTKGSYKAEHLELTADGNRATGSEVAPRDKARARFKLAIERVAPFKALYDTQKGNRLPANSVLEDQAKEHGIPSDDLKECVEMFIVNAKFLGILRPVAGAERIIPIEQVLEELPAKPLEAESPAAGPEGTPEKEHTTALRSDTQDWSTVCFYISPIGDDGSEHRQHADLFLRIPGQGDRDSGAKMIRIPG